MVTVAIVGLGMRGGFTYSAFQDIHPEMMKITAISDLNRETVKLYKEKFGVAEDRCFYSAEDFFSRERLADAVIIATQDRDHYGHAMAAIEKGYDILLEKPISPVMEECVKVERAAKEKGVHLVICHVLRYTVYYRELKRILESGEIGRIRAVEHTEGVAYWHFAHSFVRGCWKNSKQTSPIILQKCCHDTDILSWLIGDKPKSISSVGELRYFKAENAPAGSPERCNESCPVYEACPYNARRFYLESYIKASEKQRKSYWIYSAVSNGRPSVENIERELNETDYGKCVFKCDNDVCDHQVTVIEYENGAVATLTMSTFTKGCYRSTRIYGTAGEIEANDGDGIIKIKKFNGADRSVNTTELSPDLSGHLGGDNEMMREFLEFIENKKKNKTEERPEKDLVIGHVVCFAAEKSRLNGGVPISYNQFKGEGGE